MALPSSASHTLATYDPRQSYEWNYRHPPAPPHVEVPALPGGPWSLCGWELPSPLGIAAGPLLNGRWLLYYAALGFDVLVYKTVRSREHPCHPQPNLVPVACGQLGGGEVDLPAAPRMTGSWAVSFGMPSQSPEVWRPDVAETRRRLAPEKRLVVSVVGTVQPGWSTEDLADDYATCARWAVEAGADAVEANLSCPNVTTCDGQLYRDPPAVRIVARRLREAVGQRPLVLKIGHLADGHEAAALVEACHPWADALATTNSIATTVVDAAGRPLFGGARRGICGQATRDASLAQARRLAQLCAAHGGRPQIIGVGGAGTADDVNAYLAAGAAAVHLATAAMIDPLVGIAIRRGWSTAGR